MLMAQYRRFAVSPSTVSRAWSPGASDSRRATRGCRRTLNHEEDQFLLLCARRNGMRTARALQNLLIRQNKQVDQWQAQPAHLSSIYEKSLGSLNVIHLSRCFPTTPSWFLVFIFLKTDSVESMYSKNRFWIYRRFLVSIFIAFDFKRTSIACRQTVHLKTKITSKQCLFYNSNLAFN